MISNEIEPLGPPRDDMRAAINTTRLVAALTEGMTEADVAEQIEHLQHYLPVDIPEDEPVLLPEEAAEIKRRSKVTPPSPDPSPKKVKSDVRYW